MSKRKKHGLTDAQRKEAIRLFARFAGVETVLAELGLPRRMRRAVGYYDASAESSRERLARKWIDLFDAERAAYLDSLGNVAIAHPAHRIRIIQAVAAKAQKAGDMALLLKAMRAAREESADYEAARRNAEISRILLDARKPR